MPDEGDPEIGHAPRIVRVIGITALVGERDTDCFVERGHAPEITGKRDAFAD